MKGANNRNQDRYYIDEIIQYREPPKILSPEEILEYKIDALPCRIMRIIDRFKNKTPVYTVNIDQDCVPAGYILDKCEVLNQEHETYQKLVLEYVNTL